MICPHCGQTHSDELTECPVTGKKLKKSCTNKDCSYYGEFLWPLNALICPCCGKTLPYEPMGSNASMLISKGNKPYIPDDVKRSLSQIIQALQSRCSELPQIIGNLQSPKNLSDNTNNGQPQKSAKQTIEITINDQSVVEFLTKLLGHISSDNCH